MTRAADVHLVSVFAAGPGGGNPAPVVMEADGLGDGDMRAIAAAYGHESVFVLPPPAGSGCDFALRFWVPKHEMEMCGHATVGATWLLHRMGRLTRDQLSIATMSGVVEAQIHEDAEIRVEISQPRGKTEALPGGSETEAELLSILGVGAADLAAMPIRNAWTSRVKTLIGLQSVAVLDSLAPDFARLERFCERIGSTGLYPFAMSGPLTFDARQFPRSSGYPEDAATGIAAAALVCGLWEAGLIAPGDQPVHVRQGRAMGRPSRIAVRLRRGADGAVSGCWLGGDVRFENPADDQTPDKFPLPGC